MTREDFISLLLDGAADMGIQLPDPVPDRLFVYYSELQRWNRKVNLVSRQSHDWVRIHFLDSLAPLSLGLLKANLRIVDLGAGAGFPGIPLKLAMQDIYLGMAEASEKKCAWLKHLVRVLNIDGAQVLMGRSEDLLEGGWAEEFDVAVSRAAAKPHRIIDLARPFLCPGGRILVYTTEAMVEKGLGRVFPYKVPGSQVPSVIWEVET